MKRFEFWFDFSCPYAYVASTRVEALAARVGAELDARPMLLGGVFRARKTPQNLSNILSPAKAAHNLDDMRRQAQMAGVALQMPAGHPFRTVEALRCLLAVGAPFMPLAHHFYRAYWAEGRDLGQREVVVDVLRSAGQDPEAVLARANTEAIKDELRRRTDEAVERGIFGAPTCFVVDQLYWGQDRLDMVEAALGGLPAAVHSNMGLAPIDLWFDYSSPFAYLALAQAEAMFGAAAQWRPLLLGGLFRSVGTPDVPLFTLSPEKRRHTMQDLQRQANCANVPLAWPTRFPISTVLALRLTLQAGLVSSIVGRGLIVRIARALWAEDRDISDPVVLAGLCDELGFPGEPLVAAAGAAKSALFAATTAAQSAGVFGVPTFVVHRPDRDLLYWGVDRMAWAARAAAGDSVVM